MNYEGGKRRRKSTFKASHGTYVYHHGDTMARQFTHSFNAVWEKTHGDEGRSMAAGYAALNRSGAEKIRKAVLQRILTAATFRDPKAKKGTVYHGTSLKALKVIMQNGLRPRKGIPRGSSLRNLPKLVKKIKPVVYLSNDKKLVMEYAAELNGENGVVLAVDLTPKELKKYGDALQLVMYDGVIPPNRLRQVFGPKYTAEDASLAEDGYSVAKTLAAELGLNLKRSSSSFLVYQNTRYLGGASSVELLLTKLRNLQNPKHQQPLPPRQTPLKGYRPKVRKASPLLARAVLATLDQQEKEADRVAEITGGSARVWGDDELLIEDAGPGIHLHYQHSGNTLEVKLGNGSPIGIAKWLKRVAEDAKAKVDDIERVARDPNAFAKVLMAILQQSDLRCRIRGTTVEVGGQHDVFLTTIDLLSERAAEAVAGYFKIDQNTPQE